MGLDVKSRHAKLYYCANLECRVVMFKFGSVAADCCPSCGDPGELVRYPVGDRLGVRS